MVEAKDVPFHYTGGVYAAADAVAHFINALDETEPAKIRSRIYAFVMELSPREMFSKDVERTEALKRMMALDEELGL